MRFKAPCIDVTRRPRKAKNFIKYWFGSALTLCQGEFRDAYIVLQGSNYAGVLYITQLPTSLCSVSVKDQPALGSKWAKIIAPHYRLKDIWPNR